MDETGNPGRPKIIFSPDLAKIAVTEEDNTNGILFDSILYCLEKYQEFLAIGGDMPYIDMERYFSRR